MSLNGLAIEILQSMIDRLKMTNPAGVLMEGIGDPHGVEIEKIERIEDKLQEEGEITWITPQFIVWVWRELGVDSPNPCPQKMNLHELKHFILQCAAQQLDDERISQYVEDNFKDKIVISNSIVGNVYEFDGKNWAVVEKIGEKYLVVPVDNNTEMVSEYDSSQHRNVYRLKHRLLLPYFMFHKKTRVMIETKRPVNWIHQECIEEIMERIKKIESSTNPNEYEKIARKEYEVCGEKEKYQELDKEWSTERDKLCSQVERELKATGEWKIID